MEELIKAHRANKSFESLFPTEMWDLFEQSPDIYCDMLAQNVVKSKLWMSRMSKKYSFEQSDLEELKRKGLISSIEQ